MEDWQALTLSLVSGGPFFRLLTRARLTGPTAGTVLRGAAAIVALTWLPLLLITGIEGHLAMRRSGFFEDIGVHARMAIAVPFLIIGERAAGRRLGRAVRYLAEAGLIDASNRRAAVGAVATVRRLREAAWPEGAFVLLLVAASSIQAALEQPGAAWMQTGEGARLSIAGVWYLFVSLPIYRFLLLRWFWHLVLWTRFLALLVRAPLHLQSSHPDRMGGLAVVAGAHQAFGWPIFGLGASLAGYLTTRVQLTGAFVTDYTYEVGMFAVLAPLLFLSPLLVFSIPLEKLRRRSDEEYGVAAADFARRYRGRWLRPGSEPIPLGSNHPSSHTDLNTSFDRSVEVRRIPFRRTDALFLFGCAAAPMLLFLVQGMPLIEILANLRKILG